MKALLVALNASFVHTNLAVRLLQKSTDLDVKILELTINEKKDYILKKIFQMNPSHIFWSAYIWNWEIIKILGDTIYKIDPTLQQFVGGPEVSYDVEDHLDHNPWVDGIIIGEGEEIFKQLINKLDNDNSWMGIPGMAYRKEGENHINHPPFSARDSRPFTAIELSGRRCKK